MVGNRERGQYEVRIDEQTFQLPHPEPTGRELLALVGKSPEKYLLTLVIPNEPDRLVAPDETISIQAPGAEQFALVARERFYSLRVDEQAFSIPNPAPTGRELLALVGKSPDTHLLTLSLANRDDELIDPEEKVDLRLAGREQFFAVIRNPLTIVIDEVRYQPEERELTGEQLRRLAVPPIGSDRDLWLDVPGRDDLRVELADPIALTDGMVFYTAPSTINPGEGA